jgi:putative copper resistance protein D
VNLNPIWDVVFATALISTAFWYFSEKESLKQISGLRQFLFGLGLALTFILTVGPTPHYAIRFFWVHMIQHIGLMMLISPLLVLGSPVKVAMESRFTTIKRVVHVLGSNCVVRQLFKPPIGFALFLFILVGAHFSPLANAGMTNPNIHSLELVLFLVGGFIYYYAVIEGNPQPFPVSYSIRVISLFAMMLPETMVGFFLYSGNRVLHSLPEETSMVMGLNDQHQGGAIMWAMGMLIDTLWIVLAARDWFTHEERSSDGENSETWN